MSLDSRLGRNIVTAKRHKLSNLYKFPAKNFKESGRRKVMGGPFALHEAAQRRERPASLSQPIRNKLSQKEYNCLSFLCATKTQLLFEQNFRFSFSKDKKSFWSLEFIWFWFSRYSLDWGFLHHLRFSKWQNHFKIMVFYFLNCPFNFLSPVLSKLQITLLLLCVLSLSLFARSLAEDAQMSKTTGSSTQGKTCACWNCSWTTFCVVGKARERFFCLPTASCLTSQQLGHMNFLWDTVVPV